MEQIKKDVRVFINEMVKHESEKGTGTSAFSVIGPKNTKLKFSLLFKGSVRSNETAILLVKQVSFNDTTPNVESELFRNAAILILKYAG
jgi:hypothetical protein